MEFVLTSDPTGTTAHTFARVLYVLNDSPAQKAGIERGDWISAINEERITSDNYPKLMQGGALSLTRSQIINTENGLGWQVRDVLNMGASVAMEINPFLVNTILEVEGKKIAYLVYNEFATGPKNEGTESVYNEQMKQIFAQFKTQSPDAFILDLRYNNGGFLQCAQALGSLLAPSTAMGKDFVNLTFNAKANPQIIRYPFDTQYADANLNLNKIYILTGSQTASASEAVINGLIPYMGAENVILIGTKTEGKNVAMSSFKNETHGLTLWPVIAYVSNANNEGEYSEGFEPTYKLNENTITQWYPLGNPEEYLLKNTISLITKGTLSDESTSENGESKTIRSSIGYKGIRIQ
jgi:C-terminal processing protease CtpA/Prc